MTKKINGVIGYLATNVMAEPMKVIAEIETGGTDYNGYKNKQTLGLVINQYNEYALYVGSLDSNQIIDKLPTIHFSSNIQMVQISDILIELADEIESNEFERIKEYEGFKIDVFDTGNKTVWCFEIHQNKKLVAEGNNLKSEFIAYREAINFCKYVRKYYTGN